MHQRRRFRFIWTLCVLTALNRSQVQCHATGGIITKSTRQGTGEHDDYGGDDATPVSGVIYDSLYDESEDDRWSDYSQYVSDQGKGQSGKPDTQSIHRFKECGKYDFCNGRNHKYLQSPSFHNGSSWGRVMCFCDEDCVKYGDCCIDKSSPEETDLLQDHESQHWGCIPVSPKLGVHGIVGCEGSLSELCSKTNQSDVLSDIAVFSRLSGTVYANVYCALCHGVSSTDIAYSSFNTRCDHNDTLHQLKKMEYRDLMFMKRRNCSGRVESVCWSVECQLDLGGLPADTRHCRPAIQKCVAQYSEYEQACYSYSQPVISLENNRIYKNPHCALCNGDDLKHMRCYNPLIGKFKSLTFTMNFDWDFTRCQLPITVWNSRTKQCVPVDCIDGSCDGVSSQFSQETREEVIEGYLTAAVLMLSIGLLLAHNFIYYLEPKRQNVPSQILKSLCWSLILGHISFLIVDIKNYVPFPVCKIIGFSVQFFYLSSFFWMNVMSFDVWRTFSKVSLRGSSSSILRKYNCYSWGSSFLIVAITITFDLTNVIPDNYRPNLGLLEVCWFSSGLSLAIYYFLPILLLLLTNLYLFGKTVFWFQRQTAKEFEKVNNEATGRKEYHKVWLYIKLSVIMGLTWLICIVSSLTDNQILRYIFIVLNGLQGAFIFIMFDMKRRVFHQVSDNFKYRTNSSTASSDVKHLQGRETTMTHISRNNTSLSLKLNLNKK